MADNFQIMLNWLRPCLNVNNLIYLITCLIFEIFLFYLCIFLISRKKRNSSLYGLNLNKLQALILSGFIVHFLNVVVVLNVSSYSNSGFLLIGFFLILFHSLYSVYHFYRIVSKERIGGLIGVQFSNNKLRVKRNLVVGELKRYALFWFIQLLPYTLLFYKIYAVPNYSVVFDNSASMINSIEDAKSFVKQEFSDDDWGRSKFVATKIPQLGAEVQSIINEFNLRLSRENAQTGKIQVSLKWDNRNDLDIHLIEPSGNRISYRNKISRAGGILDVDMNAGEDESNKPIENIYYGLNAPAGHYRIVVDFYNKKTGIQNNRFSVLLGVNGSYHVFSGFANIEKTLKTVVDFNYQPNMILSKNNFNCGNGIQISNLNSIMSISEIVKTNSEQLRSVSTSFQNNIKFIEDINNLECDGFGSPISQMLRQNYEESMREFGNSGDNRLVIITDGEDESMVNGIYNNESFILEYGEISRQFNSERKPIDFFNKIDFIVYNGQKSGYIDMPLHELASKNAKVRIHNVDSSEHSLKRIFGDVFKDAVINWNYFFTCLFVLILFGGVVNQKIHNL
jgi:hypothetical protein